MRRPEGKALFLRNVPIALVREAKAMAARRGTPLTTIVAEALARSLGMDGEVPARADARADDLGRDIAWYRAQRPRLLRRYRGEYLAIVDSAIVDHGRDFAALAARVFGRFGNRSIYMPRVEADEPTAQVRSPRRARRARP